MSQLRSAALAEGARLTAQTKTPACEAGADELSAIGPSATWKKVADNGRFCLGS